tara:strand:+ start:154 stop:564 length:411 start_codon:yes stop_codon:yes gene_type:complete
MILFHFNTILKLHNKRLIKKWLNDACIEEGCKIGDLNYIFCDDEYLIEINKKYLNHNTLTDTISFDYSNKHLLSGDIMISVPRVVENAKKYNVEFKHELYRVMVHGLLHLLKYNDKNKAEKELMQKKEDYYINKII